MDISPEKYVQRLNEILGKKLIFLKDILSLTRDQETSIGEENIDGLEKLIDAKQEKIDAIDKLDEEFSVYFQRLKTVLKVDSLSELNASGIAGAKELKLTVSEVVEVISAIEVLEKKNNVSAKKLLDSIGGEVRKLNQGIKFNRAYIPAPMQTTSYFIDKKK